MEEYGTIKTFIDVLNANGVEFVFFNPGIDNVPVLETIAQYRASGMQTPRSILCLDEFVTMTAAHGNYMISGRPQVVSVHSELGTLQIGGALQNAQWGRVPVVFFTETQGPPQRTDWRGQPFDQGAMVRNFVKWDHQLSPDEDICAVLNQAFRIATTEPCGPVYLNLPREVLWKQGEFPKSGIISETDRWPSPQAETGDLELAADMLINAENPLIVTGYLGRNLDSMELLVKLAETLAARVMGSDIHVNFPNTHPLAAYTLPETGRANPLLATSDVILVIDYDMPYAAPPTMPLPDAKIIHIDIDTVKKGVPLWGRNPDILIQADSSQVLPVFTKIIEKQLTDERRNQLQERFSRLETEYYRIQKEWRDMAISHSDKSAITAHWLSYCINEVIDEDTLIVNQTISPSTIVSHLVQRSKPGTRLSCAGGCIGWAPGAALGVKLSAPDRTVISLMGDGAFIYGCPEASLWSANFYNAPYLAIIYNNQGYGAIKGLFRERYEVENMGADIPTPPDYAGIARACKAYGRTVEVPGDVPTALKDCLEIVKSGTPSVLDVKLEPV